MSAGVPSYQKLFSMGKLPENMRHMVPGLASSDKLQKELDTVNSILCKSCKKLVLELSAPKKVEEPEVKETVRKHIPNLALEAQAEAEAKAEEEAKDKDQSKVRCPGFQCEYIASGKSERVARNNLRLHQKGKHPDMFEVEKKKK